MVIIKKVILFLLLTLLVSVINKKSAYAQEVDSTKLVSHDSLLSLVIESKKFNLHLIFEVGETVIYKSKASDSFIKAQITGITDSTISFESKNKPANEVFRYKDLEAFKIPGSFGSRTVGLGLAILGATSLAVAHFAANDPSNQNSCSTCGPEIAKPAVIASIALVPLGIWIMIDKRKLYLDESSISTQNLYQRNPRLNNSLDSKK